MCLAPLFWLGWRAWNGDLTANPIEYITHFTGDWTIRFVVIDPGRHARCASCSTVPSLIRYRRMIGLFAFFYALPALPHLVRLDKFFDFHEILADFTKRRFIIAGLTAFLCMIPLAVTSTTGWIRRLGGKRWQLLHRLIYVTAIAAVIHYYWLVKSDIRLPLLYGVTGRTGIVLPVRRVGLQKPYNRCMTRLAILALCAIVLPAADFKIDHATVAGASLQQMQGALSAVGIASVYGGAHVNGATEMALVSFPDGSYLELMALQPNADPTRRTSTSGPSTCAATPAPAAWALRETDLAAEVQRLKAAGIPVSAPDRSGRQRPDGVRLDWETSTLGRRSARHLFPVSDPRFHLSRSARLSARQARHPRLPRHHPRGDRRSRSGCRGEALPPGVRPSRGYQAGGSDIWRASRHRR